MPGVRLTWKPKPPLGGMIRRLVDKKPLYASLHSVMIDLVNETHRHAGLPKWKPSKRAEATGGRTGYRTGRLQRGWKPVSGKPRIVNRVSYACDFYYGHGPRTVQAPESYRRLRRGRRTVGTSMVRAHTRRERAQVARPINWTKRYIKRAEKAILKHVLK